MNLENLTENQTQEEVEAQILEKYDNKNVKATYYENNNQLVLETMEIVLP
jgi:hypothetical protein